MGSTDVSAQILIDAYLDGYIEERAWVQVTDEIDTPEKAIKYLEGAFPIEDLEEGRSFKAMAGVKSWQKPDPTVEHEEDDPEIPWVAALPDDPDALSFWIIEVVEDDAA